MQNNPSSEPVTTQEPDNQKARLVIDFPNRQKMAEWFDDLRDVAIGGFPRNTALYETDALDATAITPKHTYIVRRVGDRPEEFRLVLRTVEVTERAV